MSDETRETETEVAVYTLHMRDDDGSSERVEFDAGPDADEITSACEEWVRGGDWGVDGASVWVWWAVTGPDGEETDSGREVVEVECDHAELIRGCMSRAEFERCCGDDPQSHDWTSDGEGGLRENPGVWLVGGTAMVFARHCATCGLRRVERSTGSQRNPGERDTVTYTMPDASEESDDDDDDE